MDVLDREIAEAGIRGGIQCEYGQTCAGTMHEYKYGGKPVLGMLLAKYIIFKT
jgi:hypothetical protein